MAKYRATINTERGNKISRLGRREIETHTCGWDAGVKVICDDTGIKCYETGGSDNAKEIKLLWEKCIS